MQAGRATCCGQSVLCLSVVINSLEVGLQAGRATCCGQSVLCLSVVINSLEVGLQAGRANVVGSLYYVCQLLSIV